jgi:hypothetical protein
VATLLLPPLVQADVATLSTIVAQPPITRALVMTLSSSAILSLQ